MTPFLVVLAAASPFAVWWWRRHASVRGGREAKTDSKNSENIQLSPHLADHTFDPINPSLKGNGAGETSGKIPDVTVGVEAAVVPRDGVERGAAEPDLPVSLPDASDDSLTEPVETAATSVSDTVSDVPFVENRAAAAVAGGESVFVELPTAAETERSSLEKSYVPAEHDRQTAPVSDVWEPIRGRDDLISKVDHSGASSIDVPPASEPSTPTSTDRDGASSGELASAAPSDGHSEPAAEGAVEEIVPVPSPLSEGATVQTEDVFNTGGTDTTEASGDAPVAEEEIAAAPGPDSAEPIVDAGPQLEDHVALPEQNDDDAGDERPVPLYQPPRQKPPRAPAPRGPKTQAAPRVMSTTDLNIRVHLSFDRSYFCTVGLLPELFRELDGDVEVIDRKTALQLLAQEDWYEDLYFDNIGERLRRGVELKARKSEGVRPRWLLTGREVYVLASHPRASAYVSTSRLALGRSDVVLCAAELVPQVEAILAAAGCRGYVRFGEADGAPEGWEGFRGVVPSVPLALDLGNDPFYALKPAPDIQIELEGGIRLRNSAYLAGYAPQIRLYGDHAEAVRVFVDGREAQMNGEGAFVAEGYDSPGPHAVHCEGLSCSSSYSIEGPPDSWQHWPAYAFNEADVCGPLVHISAKATGQRPFSVPMSNPLLLGSEPGQVFLCARRQSAVWKGFVPFDPVWAIPAQPLISDKRTARILQFREVLPVAPRAGVGSGIIWSNAILAAARKGLQIEGATASATACWKEYKRAARNIRRGRR